MYLILLPVEQVSSFAAPTLRDHLAHPWRQLIPAYDRREARGKTNKVEKTPGTYACLQVLYANAHIPLVVLIIRPQP
jgi:hypothetical protein